MRWLSSRLRAVVATTRSRSATASPTESKTLALSSTTSAPDAARCALGLGQPSRGATRRKARQAAIQHGARRHADILAKLRAHQDDRRRGGGGRAAFRGSSHARGFYLLLRLPSKTTLEAALRGLFAIFAMNSGPADMLCGYFAGIFRVACVRAHLSAAPYATSAASPGPCRKEGLAQDPVVAPESSALRGAFSGYFEFAPFPRFRAPPRVERHGAAFVMARRPPSPPRRLRTSWRASFR